jgi:mono/diheme cytochrome c family protein
MTSDGFFISIDATDPKFDEASTRAMLVSLGATEVEVCRTSTTQRRFPRATPWIVAATLVFAVLPPLVIAWYRAAPKRSPRIHLIGDMDFQPKYLTQAESNFFADRRTMRPPVAGTVPEGELAADDHLYRGKIGDEWATTLPIPATMAAIERGQQRYEIYCATCHGLLGNSRGMTAVRAQQRQELKWVPPVSLVGSAVRDQPVGQIFGTITHGIRTMPSYAAQIPVEDRWKIVLYVRALQRSRRAGEGDVPEDVKLKLQ